MIPLSIPYQDEREQGEKEHKKDEEEVDKKTVVGDREMDNEDLNNVVIVPNKQLLYCMHLRKPISLVSNILFNNNSLHL